MVKWEFKNLKMYESNFGGRTIYNNRNVLEKGRCEGVFKFECSGIYVFSNGWDGISDSLIAHV